MPGIFPYHNKSRPISYRNRLIYRNKTITNCNICICLHDTKKASTFQSRLSLFYISTIIKRWFQPFGLHTRSLIIASSAISFCLPPASISAAASSGSPLSSTFVSDFSGPSIPRLSAASFPLSDLRCFGFLSSASVLDSDYSASVLPFLLFPVPPHSCFPGARLRSRFRGFPFLSGLISHAFLPGSCTRLYCSFLFALPCFAPTAVPQVLTVRFHFRYFPLPVHFLSSARLPLPATQPLFLPFPFLPVSASQWLPQCSVSALASAVSPFSPA